MISASWTFLAVLACAAICLAVSAPSCSRPGLLPHPHDCTQFLACLGSQETGFEARTHQCPWGQAFSPEQSACVPRHVVPSCGDVTRVSDPLCQDQQVSCLDCSTLVYCILVNGEYVNPTNITCEKYCDPNLNACVPDLPEGCDVPGFTCTGIGYFPDPSNCTIYHICYDALENSHESHRCPSIPKKYVYVSKRYVCEPQNSTTDCVVATCPANYVGLIPYPKDSKYYVLCLPTEKLIYQCEGNLEYVESAHSCTFVCHSSGNYENTEDCTKYHVCTAGTGGFTLTEGNCPPNFGFDVGAGICKPLSMVPTCTPTTTPAPSTVVTGS